MDILFQVRVTTKFRGINLDGFEVTLCTNKELYGATLNIDNISHDFSVERRFVQRIPPKIVEEFAKRVLKVKQDLIGANPDNEEFQKVVNNTYQFTLYNEVFSYNTTDETAIDSSLLTLFDTLDRIVNIKQFLRLEEPNSKSA